MATTSGGNRRGDSKRDRKANRRKVRTSTTTAKAKSDGATPVARGPAALMRLTLFKLVNGGSKLADLPLRGAHVHFVRGGRQGANMG